jgi:hypothetical protein
VLSPLAGISLWVTTGGTRQEVAAPTGTRNRVEAASEARHRGWL